MNKKINDDFNDFQDALSSPPAALAVRVPPQSPRILFNSTHVMPGQNITVPAGSRATVVCEARYGNPPAYIEWYLGKPLLIDFKISISMFLCLFYDPDSKIVCISKKYLIRLT